MVLCVPIQGGGGGSGEVVGALEMTRKASEPPFGPEDEELVQSYLSWASLALNCARSHTSCVQEKLLNETLISLTRQAGNTFAKLNVTVHCFLLSVYSCLVDPFLHRLMLDNLSNTGTQAILQNIEVH